jgi:hypothetical protein
MGMGDEAGGAGPEPRPTGGGSNPYFFFSAAGST